MATTSERMLRLLSLLQTHRFWPGPELADRLAVSERTLRRDVERLRELGYTVDAARGIAGGYQLRGGKAVPPLLLENDEALAIAIGLHAATVQSLDGDGDAALRALTKVVSVMPVALRAQIDAFQEASTVAPRRGGPTVSTHILTSLSQACRDRLPARFDYAAADGAQTHRDTEPHALVALDTRWYLVAFDRDRRDWRTFRLDRIGELATSTLTFAARELPGGDALEFVRRNSRAKPRRHQVEVRLRAGVEEVRAMVGSWGELTVEDDGWCRWSAGVDELRWTTALLVAADCDLEPVGPPELVDSLARAWTRLAPKAG